MFLDGIQTDHTISDSIPFLCSDLFQIVKDLMGQFIKSDKMTGVKSVYQLLKIDVQAKENHSVYSNTM